MTNALHIFAVNAELDLRHTHLTRARGEAPLLPPLKDWLGVERVATGEIELFPVKDLDDMRLSDYAEMAFATDTIEGRDKARIDALEGPVLLVPAQALSGALAPGPELTQIATIGVVQPDHQAVLPKAEVERLPQPEQEADSPRRGDAPVLVIALIGLAVVIGLVLLVT